MNLSSLLLLLGHVGWTLGSMCSPVDQVIPENAQLTDLPSLKDYPHAEAGLQILSSLVIPCDGHLTQWHFLAMTNRVLGLHLAIFRPDPFKNDVLHLRGQSYVDSVWTPSNKSGSWVMLPVNPPMEVKVGDVLGYFYDRIDTRVEHLTIVSRNSRPGENDTTTVFLKDASDLFVDSQINLNDGVVVPRQSAVRVVIKSLYNKGMMRPEWRLAPEIVTIHSHTTTAVTPSTSTTTLYPSTTPTTTTTTPPPTIPITKPSTTPFVEQVFTEPVAPSAVEEYPSLPGAVNDVKTMTSCALTPRCVTLPTALESCQSLSLRAFFDYERGICRPFYGCPSYKPVSNNFDSMDACQYLCECVVPGGQSTPPPQPSQPLIPEIGKECLVPPSMATQCPVKAVRYFHNPNLNQCFSFYGCPLYRTVGNNFETKVQCLTRCNATDANEEPVLVPGVALPEQDFQVITPPPGLPRPLKPHREIPSLARPIQVVRNPDQYFAVVNGPQQPVKPQVVDQSVPFQGGIFKAIKRLPSGQEFSNSRQPQQLKQAEPSQRRANFFPTIFGGIE